MRRGRRRRPATGRRRPSPEPRRTARVRCVGIVDRGRGSSSARTTATRSSTTRGSSARRMACTADRGTVRYTSTAPRNVSRSAASSTSAGAPHRLQEGGAGNRRNHRVRLDRSPCRHAQLAPMLGYDGAIRSARPMCITPPRPNDVVREGRTDRTEARCRVPEPRWTVAAQHLAHDRSDRAGADTPAEELSGQLIAVDPPQLLARMARRRRRRPPGRAAAGPRRRTTLRRPGFCRRRRPRIGAVIELPKRPRRKRRLRVPNQIERPKRKGEPPVAQTNPAVARPPLQLDPQ